MLKQWEDKWSQNTGEHQHVKSYGNGLGKKLLFLGNLIISSTGFIIPSFLKHSIFSPQLNSDS